MDISHDVQPLRTNTQTHQLHLKKRDGEQRLKAKRKVWNLSPLWVQIQKRLHYRRFPPRDQSSEPTTITAHPHYLHVSLIMVHVYSLEDQRPTEMAGCVIKSLTLGAPKM